MTKTRDFKVTFSPTKSALKNNSGLICISYTVTATGNEDALINAKSRLKTDGYSVSHFLKGKVTAVEGAGPSFVGESEGGPTAAVQQNIDKAGQMDKQELAKETGTMNTQISSWEETNPYLVARGIDEPTWNALCSTIYPNNSPDSIILAIDYCRARKLDIMLKPVHLVSMNVTDPQTGGKVWRDVPMPGLNLYRILADRSGNYAGADEPEFGPIRTLSGTDKNNQPFEVNYPEWCKYTVYKMVKGMRVAFISKQYWIENYATQSSKTNAPNSMWAKRPFAQLEKTCESQALRKGWPEVSGEETSEEMAASPMVDITPVQKVDTLTGEIMSGPSDEERITAYVDNQIRAYKLAEGDEGKQFDIYAAAEAKLTNYPEWLGSFKNAVGIP